MDNRFSGRRQLAGYSIGGNRPCLLSSCTRLGTKHPDNRFNRSLDKRSRPRPETFANRFDNDRESLTVVKRKGKRNGSDNCGSGVKFFISFLFFKEGKSFRSYEFEEEIINYTEEMMAKVFFFFFEKVSNA